MYNKSIEAWVLQPTLKTLYIIGDFNQPIDYGVLHEELKILIIDGDFDYWLNNEYLYKFDELDLLS